MRLHLFAFVLLGASAGHAQSTNQESSAKHWWLGAQVSPDVAYRTLYLIEHNSTTEAIVDARDRSEVPRLALTAQLFAGRTLNKRFSMELGLGYALRGWQVDVSTLTYGDPLDPRRGFIYESADDVGPILEELHYLIMPVRAVCTLGNGRLRSISSLGFSADLLFQAYHISVINGERTKTEQDGYATFNITPTASTGIAYTLGARGELRAQPTFSYGALNIRTDDPIGGRLWNAGLVFGYTRRL
ncbi:MAG: hypothetical protein ABI432_02960 [Flavobacteriales bacterium]